MHLLTYLLTNVVQGNRSQWSKFVGPPQSKILATPMTCKQNLVKIRLYSSGDMQADRLTDTDKHTHHSTQLRYTEQSTKTLNKMNVWKRRVMCCIRKLFEARAWSRDSIESNCDTQRVAAKSKNRLSSEFGDKVWGSLRTPSDREMWTIPLF